MTRTLITAAQFTATEIDALRIEAACAGDDAMVKICNRALAGSKRARAACLKIVRDVQRERLGR
jgi:hypothetical protein